MENPFSLGPPTKLRVLGKIKGRGAIKACFIASSSPTFFNVGFSILMGMGGGGGGESNGTFRHFSGGGLH